MYKFAKCIESPDLQSRICLFYMIKTLNAPLLTLPYIWELGTWYNQADASSLGSDSGPGDSKQQGWRRIRSDHGPAVMAAASGFQWQQRQLFWGSVQCPTSEDLAVQAMESVSAWQLWWWLHRTSSAECFGCGSCPVVCLPSFTS